MQLIKDQRLIYAGHLLNDEKTLRSAFEPLNGENIHVHLVCAQRYHSDSRKPDNQALKASSPQAPTLASPSVAVGSNNQSSPHSISTNNSVSTSNQQIPFINQSMMMPGMFSAVPGAMTPVMWTPEQMAQMQQIYTQFLAQYNLQPNVTIAPVPLVYPQMFNTNVQANEPLNVAPIAPVVGEQAPAAGPVRMDDADDDDEENRDWLDLFYWLSRAVVLFSVVYFYSSFTRFVLVVGIAILMYMHQIGLIFPRNNNRQVPNRRQEPPAVDRQRDTDGDDDYANDPLIEQQPPVREATTSDPERCSGLRLFWVIVSSLFTSLIPETQAPVNFN